MPGPENGSGNHEGRARLVDVDRLEALLVEAARARRSLTYAEVLAHFGLRITPRRVYALCRDLGAVCARNRARGEPELAVLVVRKSDRLPGEGFFHSLWRDGATAPTTAPRPDPRPRPSSSAKANGSSRTSPGAAPETHPVPDAHRTP
jgi:hypothetical protein